MLRTAGLAAALLSALAAMTGTADASTRCSFRGSRPFSEELGGFPGVQDVTASGITCYAAGVTTVSGRGPDLKSRAGEGVPVYMGIVAGMDEWHQRSVIVVRPPAPAPRTSLAEYVEPPLQRWTCRSKTTFGGQAMQVTCRRGHATVTAQLGE